MKRGVKKIIGGGILLFLGMFLPVALIVPMMLSSDADVILRAPGTIEVTINKPGRHVLWHHYTTVVDGRSYAFGKTLPGGLEFSLVDLTSGQPLPMRVGTGMTTVSGGTSKAAVGQFDVPGPGRYVLGVTGTEEARIFSLGPSGLAGGFMMIGVMMIGGFAAVAAAIGALVLIVIGIVELVRASRAEQGKAR